MAAATTTDLDRERRLGEAVAPPSPRGSRALEIGLGIAVIAVPLAVLPMSYAPFVDIKLVLLIAGAVAVWAGARVPSRLLVPAAIWVAVLAVAGLFGVDPWWSLVGPENTGNGLILLGASAFFLVAGTSVPVSIRARVPVWLVGTSTAAGAVAILYRVWPGLFERVVTGLSFEGGLTGNAVYLAGLLGVGLIAALALTHLPARLLLPVVVVQASALALSTKRVGWVVLAVGIVVALWRSRIPRPRALLVVGVVAATLAGWTFLDVVVRPDSPLSGARRFGELNTDSASARLAMTPAMGRAWARRPALGWGPGNVWGAYVSSATVSELRAATRGVGDAHNLVLETAVTSGAIGLAALLLLVGGTVREMRRGPPAVGWAAGGAAALGAYHLLQPNNVALTPLLFLLAGMACRPPPDDISVGAVSAAAATTTRSPWQGLARGVAGALLAGGLILATTRLGASVLEQYDRTYYSPSALRASLALAPGRVSAAEALALSLALDGREGDERAAREAVELAERTVRLHPWNPGVRLVAADVHVLIRDPEGAVPWVERHLGRFPHDPIPRPPDAGATAVPSS